MSKDEKQETIPEYDGLIFYDVDNDKLARKVGKKLEENPPESIKVIRYTGEKNFQGLRKYTNDFIYIEDLIDSLDNNFKDFDSLQKMDGPVFDQIWEWEEEQMKKYEVKFSMELHDTPHKRKRPSETIWNMNISLSTVLMNKPLINLLDDYCKEIKPMLHSYENILSVYMCGESHHRNPFNQITVEIEYDPMWIEEIKGIHDTCAIIINLAQHIRKNK